MKSYCASRIGILFCSLLATVTLAADEWPDWRGPGRDGISHEAALPERWSPSGENLAWKAPYGGRSTPIVFGGRVFLLNGAGQGDSLQERVVCLDANTGKLLWEYRFNVFHSDVPMHRIGWASPVVDRANGNVYAFGVGGMLVALSKDGKRLWDRSINEDFGLVTTHGGRTMTPIVEGDLIIVGSLNSGWGDQARGNNRYFAFDKRNGDLVWVSNPQARHYDTAYSSPIAADVNGMRLVMVGGTDGAIHALKAQTGEPVWKYEVSKRAINTNVVMNGTTAIATHSEENFDTNEMGRISAIDATATGAIGPQQLKWSVTGFQGGFSSPVIDGDRIYQVDNSAVIAGFDLGSGKQLWSKNLGTIQKAALVLGDGKLYVGTENGRFFILRPNATGVDVLDEDWLGSEAAPEPIIGAAAISNGRVYVMSTEATYAIGANGRPAAPAPKPGTNGGSSITGSVQIGNGAPTYLQVVPAETIVAPGAHAKFRARLFDAKGVLLREEPVTWSLDTLKGTVNGGDFVPAADGGMQAGAVKASVGGISGSARVRVIQPLPWRENFDQFTSDAPPQTWINGVGKFLIREVDGNKVLVKLADNPFTKRTRVYMGPASWSDYTVEVDVRATERRRQMGDAGVIAQRYALVLFGNSQKIELQPWQPNTLRTVTAPFAWKPDTWYRMKLRVENLKDGTTRVQGKAWPAADPEPQAWTVEKIDKIPHREGTPGLYADASAEIFFDNLNVSANR